MSRNGAGVYSLPAGNPVVTGTTISSTVQNNTMSDVATALTQSIAVDGQSVITNSIPFGNNKATQLAAGTQAGDALSYAQAGSSLAGLTLTSALVMSGAAINEAHGADIASASTINLDTATGNYVDVTGTTTITAITLTAGIRVTRFTGILVLTNGASLVNITAANITTAAGDYAVWGAYSGGVVRMLDYVRASGLPLVFGTSSQTANTVFAGPTTGAAAPPAFRALVAADIPLVPLTSITNSLSGDVALNNSSNYFDGPSVAQGTSGTWLASGTVSLKDTSSAGICFAKLWDGTTVIASGTFTGNATNPGSMSLSGIITNPAANIRISVRCTNTTTSSILFNATGNSKDSTVSAVRIG